MIRTSTRSRRLATLLTTLFMPLLLAAPAAAKATGALSQVDAPAGCVSHDEWETGCTPVPSFGAPKELTISPDGRHVYAASSGLVVLERDQVTARLTPLPEPDGCHTDPTNKSSQPECSPDLPSYGGDAVVVSPDGKHVYHTLANGVAAFSRHSVSGKLKLLPGEQGCVWNGGAKGCSTATGLDQPIAMAISPDGKSLYVTSFGYATLVTLQRDPVSGALSFAGCHGKFSLKGCTKTPVLDSPGEVEVSPDGTSVVVTSTGGLAGGAVAVFSRDAETGKLTPLSGPGGCFSSQGKIAGCAAASALGSPGPLAFGPEGSTVYIGSWKHDSVAVFSRDAATGRLTQLPGAEGCLSDSGTGGACADVKKLHGPSAIVVSGDGSRVHVAARDSSAVSVFARNLATGKLVQLEGVDACVSALPGPCGPAPQLGQPTSLAASPDGRSLYSLNQSPGAAIQLEIQLPPSCDDVLVSTAKGFKVAVPLKCSDPNGDVLTREIVAAPPKGKLGAIDQAAGTVTYFPKQGFTGDVEFQFRSSDGSAQSKPATATVRVLKPVEDPGGVVEADRGGDNGRATPDDPAPPDYDRAWAEADRSDPGAGRREAGEGDRAERPSAPRPGREGSR